MENYFSYLSTKTYVVGTQKNRLNDKGSSEQPKHMLKLMSKKIITVKPVLSDHSKEVQKLVFKTDYHLMIALFRPRFATICR